MHDTDTFARMPALDSTAEQPLLSELLLAFTKECDVLFKDETYSARDNGAVRRYARPGARKRRLDDIWTFGTLNRHSGYFEIAGHVVHRIVATAFHGPGPSPEHVVDHIDTNRQNNRCENLRWVTRLENILLNPITRARIVMAYGSLDAFFENPSGGFIPNWDWMRVVTKEEAKQCRERLEAWAQTAQGGSGGALGGWLFEPGPHGVSLQVGEDAGSDPALGAAQREALDVPVFMMPVTEREVRRPGAVAVRGPDPEPLDVPSLTPNAFQRKWRTPTLFPQCPETVTGNALADYLLRLTPGAVFTRNRYGENSVVAAALGDDQVMSVVCSAPPDSVKGWTRAKVYLDGGQFCHESGGTFFTEEGAMKAHCVAIGAPIDAYGETIDDYC